MRTNSRFTLFAAVALKFAASYVIVTAYLVKPRGVAPFIRFLNMLHLTMPLVHLPAFSFLCVSNLSIFFANPEAVSTCVSFASSPSRLAAFWPYQIWVCPDCSGFILLFLGGSFRHPLSRLISLARHTKTCLLSSLADANIPHYIYSLQIINSVRNTHYFNNPY